MASPLIAVVGPTAAGKSALALRLAREHGGEIVSCDSLQVYRGLDIGSAKATPEERASVPHHLIDVVEPDAVFSAADYARLAREATAAIRARGRLPVVAGGTGLYLRALLYGLFEGPSRNEALRARLERIAVRFGDARLHRLLRRVDPRAAERTHPQRPRPHRAGARGLRAHGPADQRAARRARAGRSRARSSCSDSLRTAAGSGRPSRRAPARCWSGGSLEEVRALMARFGEPLPRPLAAIGYRQAVSVLRGELTLEAAEQSIVTETLRFAKRQMTWFRHQTPRDVRWFEDPEAAYGFAAGWLDSAEPPSA